MPLKPTNLNIGVNPYCPREDHLLVAYSFDEGSPGDGHSPVTLVNKGVLADEFDGTIKRLTPFPPSITDDNALDNIFVNDPTEGLCVDLNIPASDLFVGPHFIQIEEASKEIELWKGTVLIRFKTENPLNSGNAPYPIWNNGTAGNDNNVQSHRLRAFVNHDGTDFSVRVLHRYERPEDSGTFVLSRVTTIPIVSPTEFASEWHTLILRWGDLGLAAWLDGQPLMYDVDTDEITPSKSRFGRNEDLSDRRMMMIGGSPENDNTGVSSSFKGRISAFYHWDIELDENDINDLHIDPYWPLRPLPETTFRTMANPIVGRPTTTTATLRFVTNIFQPTSDAIYVRVQYATNRFMQDATITESKLVTETPDDPFDFVLGIDSPELNPGTEYYAFVEYSSTSDFSSDVNRMPGGIFRFVTQRTDTDEEFSFIIYGDDHVTNDSPGGKRDSRPDETTGQGQSIVDNGNTASRKWFAIWQTDYHIHKNTNPDFIIHMGDSWMGDNENEATESNKTTKDDDYREIKYEQYQRWSNFHQFLTKTSGMFLTFGNHEGENGYNQHSDLGNDLPLQKQCTIVRKKFMPNPTNTTYPEGGENQGNNPDAVDWIPELDGKYDSNYRNNYIYESHASSLSENTYNKSPLENYYAFTWGNTLVCVVDVTRYTDVGDKIGGRSTNNDGEDVPIGGGGSHRRWSRPWKLGEAQTAWLETTLANSTAKWKVVVMHNMLGGEYIGVTSDTTFANEYYGRGSGIRLSTDAEFEFHRMMKKYGVIAVFKGHDHKFCHVENDGVNYITAPTTGAPSHTTAGNIGWNFSQIENSYGTSQSKGREDSNSQQMPPGLKHLTNAVGYIKVTVTPDEFKIENIHTSLSYDDNDFVNLSGAERVLTTGPNGLISDSADQVVLENTPTNIGFLVDEDNGVFSSFPATFNDGVEDWWANPGLLQTFALGLVYAPEEEIFSRDWSVQSGSAVRYTHQDRKDSTIQLIGNSTGSPIHGVYVPSTTYTANLYPAQIGSEINANLYKVVSDIFGESITSLNDIHAEYFNAVYEIVTAQDEEAELPLLRPFIQAYNMAITQIQPTSAAISAVRQLQRHILRRAFRFDTESGTNIRYTNINDWLEDNNVKVTEKFAEFSDLAGFDIDNSNLE